MLRGKGKIILEESPGPNDKNIAQTKQLTNCDSHFEMDIENTPKLNDISEGDGPGPTSVSSFQPNHCGQGKINRSKIERLFDAQLKRENILKGKQRRRKQRRLNKRFRYNHKQYKKALKKLKDKTFTFVINREDNDQKMFIHQEKITFKGKINNSDVNLEVDTGSGASILSLETILKCEPQFQEKYEKIDSNVQLFGVSGELLQQVGLFRIPIILPIIGQTMVNFFIVTNNQNNNLIGLDFMVEQQMKIKFLKDTYVLSFGKNPKNLQIRNKNQIPLRNEVAIAKIKIGKQFLSPGLYEVTMDTNKKGLHMPPSIIKIKRGVNKVKLTIGAKQFSDTHIPKEHLEFCFTKLNNDIKAVPWNKLKWSDLKKDIELPTAEIDEINDHFKLFYDVNGWSAKKDQIKSHYDTQLTPEICTKCILVELNKLKGNENNVVCRLHVTNPNLDNIDLEQDKDFLNKDNEISSTGFKPGELTVPEFRTDEEIDRLVSDKIKNLPLEAQKILKPVLIENESQSKNSWDVPHLKEKFHFELDKPVYKNTKIYPTKKSDLSTLYATLQFLIWYGLIERAPLDQQYGAPLFLIPRKEVPGKSARPCRIVLDMRQANQALGASSSASMSACYDQIRNIAENSTYVSSLDLTNMYYSCRVSDEVLETGFQNFVTTFGVFRYLCCISGASNSPVFANCKLQENLHNDSDSLPTFLNYTSSFYDDVNLSTDSSIDLIEHCHMLVTLIRRIHRTGFMVSLEKSSLAVNLETESVNILGMEISKSKIICSEKRKKDIIDCLKTPKSVKDLQGLIGLVNYCRNLLSAKDLKYLTILSSKLQRNKLVWDQEGEECLENLRKSLENNDLAINLPTKNSIPVLFTDANKENISAILFYIPIKEFDKPINIKQSFEVPISLQNHFDKYNIVASVISEEKSYILEFCHTVYYTYIKSINPSFEALIKMLANTLLVNSSVLRGLVGYNTEEEVKQHFNRMIGLLYKGKIDTERFPFTEHVLLHSLSSLLNRQLIIFFHLNGYSNSKPYVKLGEANENAPICIAFDGNEYRLIALMTQYERILPFSNFEINNLKGPELTKLFRDLSKKNIPQFAGCFSKKLPESWRDTPIFAKELLALSSGLHYFESYLNVTRSFAMIDSATVAQGLRNVKQKNLASKLGRISIALSNNYPHLSIVQTPSSCNPADYLSRIDNNLSLNIQDEQIMPINQFIEENLNLDNIDRSKIDQTAIKVNVISSEILTENFDMLKVDGIVNETMISHPELLKDSRYKNVDGSLFLDNKRFIPNAIIPYLILKVHIELGHVGQEKILDYLNTYYCFLDKKVLTLDVAQIINACYLCGISKSTFYKPFLYESRYDYKPFEIVQIDVMETTKFFNKSRRFPVQSILGIIDVSTKYISIHYLPSGGANEICTAMMSYLSAHPTPRKIHCDNATVFRSEKMKYLCSIFGIELMLSSPYRSRARALIENKFLEYREFSRRFHTLYPNLPYEVSYAFCTRVLNSRKIKNVPASPEFLAHYQGNKLFYANDFKTDLINQYKGKLVLTDENGLKEEDLEITEVYDNCIRILEEIERKKREKHKKGRVKSTINKDDIVLRRNYGKTGKHQPSYFDPCVVTIKKGALLVLVSLISGIVHLRHHMDVKKLGKISENKLPRRIIEQYKLYNDQLIENLRKEGATKISDKRVTRGDKGKEKEIEKELEGEEEEEDGISSDEEGTKTVRFVV